jgi:DHA2 family multidrug resistance protein
MAMAVFGMVVMLGPAVGPTLGGYIVDHWHWSWIFFINLPVGALGLFMVSAFVHEDEGIRAQNHLLAERERKNVDWVGIALLSIGLSTLVYFLEEGERSDWFDSRVILGCFAVAVGSLLGFVARELTAKAPAVNVRLFKDAVFTSGTLIGALMFAMLMANMFLLPLFMQELLGFTATQSGMALIPRVAVMMVAVPIVGRLYNHLSPALMIGFGIFMFAIGAWDMSHLTLQSGVRDVIFAVMIQGVGFACLFVPLTTVALTNIPRHRIADATGLNSLLRQIGGAVGLAVFATLLNRFAVTARVALVADLSPYNPMLHARLTAMQQSLVARGLPPASAEKGAIALLEGMVGRQSLVLSYDKVFLLAGILFLMVLPLLYFLRTGGTKGAEVHVE